MTAADDSEREWTERVYLRACKLDRLLTSRTQEAQATLDRLGEAAGRASRLKSSALAYVGTCLRKRDAGKGLPDKARDGLDSLEGELGELESLVDPW